ncbi:ABC transporter ATP-binding protein [Halalkalicoccus sp. NIPERK01]|uniref:ABC transporter ATP-binding protein n=1 Tax=Halalkalicoccus sp. NIPERK01 TaxID=3053469 RepID=UPI00256EF353|nr:ABC transporter ATP-binding protein [Halalkalicoccus sp. NIPERK01]MDL5362897.1 ABC transporter ATP-binding protein [Halalkalicoccus sp. NIPERK01]
MAAIELHGVSKRYDDVVAVEDLDLEVREGEVFGFLGPNGAGKSTTINMILDFVHPSRGSIEVLGYDAHADSLRIRERIGVLPEGFDVYDRLTGRKHVAFAVDSKGAGDDPDALLERVGIADAADRKAGDYSKGMRQRLALAMALVGDPDLLVLDEPSTGLDPNGALEMREIVREEVDRGATVFFSSHILGQVEAVCDRVGILREGRLVAEDSVSGLREAAGADATLRITVGELPSRAVDELRGMDGVSGVERDGSTLRVGVENGSKTAVLSTLEEEGAEVRDFETEEASLEDLFRAYTEGAA